MASPVHRGRRQGGARRPGASTLALAQAGAPGQAKMWRRGSAGVGDQAQCRDLLGKLVGVRRGTPASSSARHGVIRKRAVAKALGQIGKR